MSNRWLPQNCPCGAKGTKKCGRCHIQPYCSKECQKAHWKNEHKHDCVEVETGKLAVTKISLTILEIKKNDSNWYVNPKPYFDNESSFELFQCVNIGIGTEFFWCVLIYGEGNRFVGVINNILCDKSRGYDLGNCVRFGTQHIFGFHPKNKEEKFKYIDRLMNIYLHFGEVIPRCVDCQLTLHAYASGDERKETGCCNHDFLIEK